MSHISQNYQDANVHTASPAKMRLMLIERAVEVAGLLSESWRSAEKQGANEHSLKLLDLLSELLSGVKGGSTEEENEVCRKVSDLYVFLLQHLVSAQTKSDPTQVEEIKLVLETEAETWRAACAQESTVPPSYLSPNPSGGLNFSA